MIYVKINDALYPAAIRGRVQDRDWDNRESLAVTLEMTYDEAMALFTDDLVWGHVREDDETGETTAYDDSDYSVAGAVTDHRDGKVTVKMGQITAEEALAELMEVLNT